MEASGSADWAGSRWPVRTRILAAMLLVTAVGMAVAGFTAFLVQRHNVLLETDDRLLARVEAARFVVTGQPTTEGGDVTTPATPPASSFASASAALEAVLSRVIPGRNESALGIVDGKATFVPGVQIDFHLEDDPALIDRVVGEVADGSVRMGTAVSSLGNLRYVATPIVVGDAAPAVYVAAIDLDGELAELDQSFRTYAVVAAASLVAVGLVGWFVAGRLLRPLRQLRETASRITASDLSERIPVTGRDDVSELTVTVNGMLERLDIALASQRQLLDDVRHELKTPITIVRGNLEVLDPSDTAEVAATRELVLDELDRMAGLVDDIEFLAEARSFDLQLAEVDVAELTADVFAKTSGVGRHEWRLAEQAGGQIELDRARVTQAWLQLADNAAKYAPDGSPIDIGSTRYTDGVELWVADRGHGVPEEARTRIFERFGRVDTGRGIRGSGLGLPIVATIAEAHGGHVSLDSSPEGSRFGIVLPLGRSVSVSKGADEVPVMRPSTSSGSEFGSGGEAGSGSEVGSSGDGDGAERA